jgi:hypothetical protein
MYLLKDIFQAKYVYESKIFFVRIQKTDELTHKLDRNLDFNRSLFLGKYKVI